MKMRVALALAVITVSALFAVEERPSEAVDPNPVPVDDSMHHLMEYVFEPSFKRLKSSMAVEPADKSAWSAVKADSLTLAESANLLLHRLPDDDQESWIALAVEARTAGGELYQAARKNDFALSSERYRVMVNRCNACHDKFADGEHQLKP